MVYMNQSVGIGEHSDVVEAIQEELDKMAAAQDRIEMLATLLSWVIMKKVAITGHLNGLGKALFQRLPSAIGFDIVDQLRYHKRLQTNSTKSPRL